MAYFHTTVLDEQIKALPTVDTASGSVATFDTDMTENLVEVKCQILAKQEGSGIPSPSNPRPIGVYDSLTLYHNDINIWDEIAESGSINNSDGTNVNAGTNRIRSKNYIPCKASTNYYFYNGTVIDMFVYFYKADKSFISMTQVNGSFQTPSNCSFIRFRTNDNYGTTYNHDISINYPSTDTQYHAFNGVYIPFGQTVAQGLLNVGTGKLRVTHYTDNLANLSWQTRYTGTTNKTLSANLTEYYKRNNSYFVAEQFERISGVAGASTLSDTDNKTVGMYDIDNSGYPTSTIIYIVLPVGDTPSGKIVYKLATPIDIQLDSITLQALLNENNIWCDTGDTEVKYLLSVGKKIA